MSRMLCGWVVLIAVGCAVACAGEGTEGQHRDSVDLMGDWSFALGDGDEGAETAAGQAKLKWQATKVPGQLMEWKDDVSKSIKFAWMKRTFKVTEAQAKGLAVLRWNHITLGATAFVNGAKVGENEPTGPYQVILPKGLLRGGENEIVLKVCGAAGVRKAKSGYFLIPAGFASSNGRGMPAITDDIWIDLAGGAYLKWVLAMPDVAGAKVRIRVTLAGLERMDGLRVTAAARPWPKGEVVGRGETAATLAPVADAAKAEHFVVEVPMAGFKPWTHEECNLYGAEVQVQKGETVLDAVTVRFGMREIKVADGNYKLNGRNLWLRGSNLVFEWQWGDLFKGKEKDYLMTEAREMSMNCFRTHTQPPCRTWADVCDEYGTMILAEFPCLYNYRNYQFTAEEYEVWHRNVLSDAAGWMARLWNHPSVIMWVLSNESRNDNEWERGPYQAFVNALDPTRPTMRTGTDGTKENVDFHACNNVTRPHEGEVLKQVGGWMWGGKGRTVTNSEYMNSFKRPITQWTGTDDKAADALAYAQLGAEHTEAMRRARLDAILPYMYAGWTRTRRGGAVWKGGFAQPVSAAWHSALSPVLATLDLFDANYRTGQEVTTDLWLVNDSWHDAKIHVDLLLTSECPEFIPEAACFEKPVSKWSFDYEVKADSVRKEPVKWKLPEAEGAYWLTARTTGVAGRAVLSQRFVRAVRPAEVPEAAKKRTYVVLGGDAASAGWFAAKGLKTSESLDGLKAGEHVVVVWNAGGVTAEQKKRGKELCEFAGAGGRVVVLSTRGWDWAELCDVKATGEGGSRVFVQKGVEHAMLAGVMAESLVRWNGLPGTVAAGEIAGAAVEAGRKVLWVREPSVTVAAEVQAKGGKGTVLFSQLAVQGRVDAGKANYDPVAERVLVNMLCGP